MARTTMKAIERNGNAVAVVLAVCSAPALGQWVEQRFDLEPGWNTLHLEVDPSPALAKDLFSDLPIEAVWTEVESRWRVWAPNGEPAHPVNNLRTIRGGRVYLIRASETTTLTVAGRPNLAETSCIPGFNLVGFHVFWPGESRPAPPTIAAYLARSPAYADCGPCPSAFARRTAPESSVHQRA